MMGIAPKFVAVSQRIISKFSFLGFGEKTAILIADSRELLLRFEQGNINVRRN